jgi:hypothetical protein
MSNTKSRLTNLPKLERQQPPRRDWQRPGSALPTRQEILDYARELGRQAARDTFKPENAKSHKIDQSV